MIRSPPLTLVSLSRVSKKGHPKSYIKIGNKRNMLHARDTCFRDDAATYDLDDGGGMFWL